MLSKQLIDKFYEDVDKLDIKFKVATIAEKTGYSKGNVSEFLNKKKEPSEKFISAFYTSFSNSSTNVPRIPNEEHPDTRDLIRVLKQQNEILQRDKERLFTIIEVSLAPLVDMVEWQRAATAAGLEWEALKAGSRLKAAEVSGKLDKLIQKNQEAWKKKGKVPREDSVSIP